MYHPTVLRWSCLYSRHSTNASCINNWIATNASFEQNFNFRDEKNNTFKHHKDGQNDTLLLHGFKDQSFKLNQIRNIKIPQLKWRLQSTAERLTLDP